MTNEKRMEFIQYFKDRAEGFDTYEETEGLLLNQGTYIATPHDEFAIDQDSPLWRKVYYPLFLQRAVEGVNTSLKGWFISQDCQGIRVYRDGDSYYPFNYDDYKNVDMAKEASLIYVWECEWNS